MNALSHKILAAAGFTLNQNRQLAAGGPHDLGAKVGHGFGVANQGGRQFFAALPYGFGVVEVVQGAFKHAPLPNLVAGFELADPLVGQQGQQTPVQWLGGDAVPFGFFVAENEDTEGSAVFAFDGFEPEGTGAVAGVDQGLEAWMVEVVAGGP